MTFGRRRRANCLIAPSASRSLPPARRSRLGPSSRAAGMSLAAPRSLVPRLPERARRRSSAGSTGTAPVDRRSSTALGDPARRETCARKYTTAGFGAGILSFAGNKAQPLLAPVALPADRCRSPAGGRTRCAGAAGGRSDRAARRRARVTQIADALHHSTSSSGSRSVRGCGADHGQADELGQPPPDCPSERRAGGWLEQPGSGRHGERAKPSGSRVLGPRRRRSRPWRERGFRLPAQRREERRRQV